ncbi:MAG TPA: TetR/AcrR family transcriptional regulator [Acidimicrobiales bacterium]|nr:TetR/AcrR family transcriptional regulator [Acidimicrobiales bacterium]
MAVVDLRGQSNRAAEDDQQARVVEAALRCIARWGQAKTSLDDVAREAGLSRATVYRLVPGGKENLMVLVSTYELNRFFVSLHEAVQGVDTLEDTLVTGVTAAARHLQHHGALKFMLDHEPEHILPLFAFTNLDRILENVRAFGAPYLAPWLGHDAGRCAEWVARIVLSYTCAPSPEYDLTDNASARRLVRRFVLPGITTVVNNQ